MSRSLPTLASSHVPRSPRSSIVVAMHEGGMIPSAVSNLQSVVPLLLRSSKKRAPEASAWCTSTHTYALC